MMYLRWAPPVCAIVLVGVSWFSSLAAEPVTGATRGFSEELLAAQQEYLIALSARGFFARTRRAGESIMGRSSVEATRARLLSLGMAEQEIAELESTGVPTGKVPLVALEGAAIGADRARITLAQEGHIRRDEIIAGGRPSGTAWPDVQLARRARRSPKSANLVLHDVLEGVTPAVELALIKAIMAQESSFRANAVRFEPRLRDASYGLMQLLSGTAKDLGYAGHPLGLLDPATNIFYGVRYLKQLMGRYAQIEDVIAAYNAGRPTRAASGTYVNQGYVNGVLNHLRHFRAESIRAGP